MMRQAQASLEVDTAGPRLTEITAPVRQWVAEQRMRDGLLTLFCPHTSASLLIQENASPEVRADLLAFFSRLVPESESYAHADEGRDDMPAHLKTALTQTSLSIPLVGSRVSLGEWQGIFLFEHRRQPLLRTVVMHLIGS